jgi:hypothetical protein
MFGLACLPHMTMLPMPPAVQRGPECTTPLAPPHTIVAIGPATAAAALPVAPVTVDACTIAAVGCLAAAVAGVRLRVVAAAAAGAA